MKLAVGSDGRTNLTDSVVDDLRKRGHELQLVGPLNDHQIAWPSVARAVAEQVASGSADEGVLFCWTGTGVSIAANKVPGIRAALCADPGTASGARRWNNANVICLSLRRTSEPQAIEILHAWFDTSYEPNEEDDACLDQVAALESSYMRPIERQAS